MPLCKPNIDPSQLSSTGKRLFHGDFEQWNMEHEAYAKTVNTASFMALVWFAFEPSSSVACFTVCISPTRGSLPGKSEPTIDTLSVPPVLPNWYYIMAGGGAILFLLIVIVMAISCRHLTARRNQPTMPTMAPTMHITERRHAQGWGDAQVDCMGWEGDGKFLLVNTWTKSLEVCLQMLTREGSPWQMQDLRLKSWRRTSKNALRCLDSDASRWTQHFDFFCFLVLFVFFLSWILTTLSTSVLSLLRTSSQLRTHLEGTSPRANLYPASWWTPSQEDLNRWSWPDFDPVCCTYVKSMWLDKVRTSASSELLWTCHNVCTLTSPWDWFFDTLPYSRIWEQTFGERENMKLSDKLKHTGGGSITENVLLSTFWIQCKHDLISNKGRRSIA